jgi:hypothetical protein
MTLKAFAGAIMLSLWLWVGLIKICAWIIREVGFELFAIAVGVVLVVIIREAILYNRSIPPEDEDGQ